MIVAMDVDITRAHTMAMPTTIPKCRLMCMTAATDRVTAPHSSPMMKPIRTSRANTRLTSDSSMRPVASPRMIIVEDCNPTLPPIAAMTGINVTRATTSSIVYRKNHRIEPDTILPMRSEEHTSELQSHHDL